VEAAFRERLGNGLTESTGGSGDESEFGSCWHEERVAEVGFYVLFSNANILSERFNLKG
jgi:hypothetical protein